MDGGESGADGRRALRERFRAQRALVGLKQEDVAARAGLTQGYVSRIESGLRPVPASLRGKLAKALRMSRKRLDAMLDSAAETALRA